MSFLNQQEATKLSRVCVCRVHAIGLQDSLLEGCFTHTTRAVCGVCVRGCAMCYPLLMSGLFHQ